MARNGCKINDIALSRAEQMDSVYDAAMRLELAFPGCKIDIHNDQHEACMCFVTIRGGMLSTDNPILFCDAVQNAANIEIYPLKNGDIRIALGFVNAAE